MNYRFNLLLVIVLFTFFYSCQQTNDNKPDLALSVTEDAQVKIVNSTVQQEPAVIYRSEDLGMTWSAYSEGIPTDATLSGIVQDGEVIYVATDFHGIYMRMNEDNEWTQLNSQALNNLDINCIVVDKQRLVIGTFKQGILISNDGGSHWVKPEVNVGNIPIRAFIQVEENLYAGTDNGIFVSTDMGNTWAHEFGKIQILGFTYLNNKIYAATQNGALVNNGEPSSWDIIYNGDALHDISNDGQYIYAMTIGQQLLKTKNDGKVWENAQNGITQPANYYTNELIHIGSNVFSAQWIGIYHSSNNGTSWEKLDGLPDLTAFSTLANTDYGIIAGISIR